MGQTPTAIAHRPIGLWMMLLGLAGVVLTFWGTSHYAFPFYAHTYPFAWYGLILFLDGLLYWRWNDGLILKSPREFGVLLFWSAMFWFFFELWNLHLKNWYFVGASPEGWWSHAEAYLDFATVLPGLFLIYRLFCCLRIPRSVKTRFHLPGWTQQGSLVIGFFMLVLPLAYPDDFFPLVWGAPALLLDPLCAKYGTRSLLEDGRRGEWTPLVRLLLAGIICGGYWELCNFWSLEKWIYTVPFFSQGKLFEMPYLGFLGFPPFCVTCYVMTNALYLLRRGRHWDPEARRAAGQSGALKSDRPFKGTGKAIYVVLAVGAIFLSEWTYGKMKVHTIDSRAEPLEEVLKDIRPGAAEALREKGWCYPEQVLDHWTEARASLGGAWREPVRRRLELSSLLHLGGANARLLEIAGVDSREKLANQEADALYERVERANKAFHLRDQPILKRRVRAWINAARRQSFVY